MVSIRSHLAKGRVESLLQALGFFPLSNINSQRQSVQWVGRRCCAAGYDGRAAARPCRPQLIIRGEHQRGFVVLDRQSRIVDLGGHGLFFATAAER